MNISLSGVKQSPLETLVIETWKGNKHKNRQTRENYVSDNIIITVIGTPIK